ncbi:MAG TPA: carboxynorspermidine decarboxylase [Rhodothermales bacterium]|nr:carboxynorspermidine decarboxylase [Rhodothermales bacterium]
MTVLPVEKTIVPTTVDFTKLPSPCFIMEERLLRRNLEKLHYVKEQSGCTLILALKGFSLYSTFPMVRQYLDGATASSLHEARLCVEEMKTLAHVYAPIYLDAEFEEMLSYACHLTFNTLNQWERFKNRVTAYEKETLNKISCGIRINPQYSEVETEMYNPCVPGSRLGITADHFGETLPKGIEGLHFHTLCEKDSYTLERTLVHVEAQFGHLLHQAKWVNFGGGHLITRRDYNPDHLIALIRSFQERYQVEVILEPGSAIGWQTGYLLSTVQDIFDSQGIQVAMLDVSFAAHMPDTLEMPYKPRIHHAYQEPIQGKPTYRFGGMTCLAGDFMGDYSFDEPLDIGDRVVFDDMMHYTMVKTTTFNGVHLPSIGVWHEDNYFELLRSYGYETFKDRLG